MKKIVENKKLFQGLAALLVAGFLLYRASADFYAIAWGTGTWQGEFSRAWAFLYYSFTVFCVLAFFLLALFLLAPHFFTPFAKRIIATRQKMGGFRWLLWLAVLIAPVWFFQYTAWGLVFQKLYLRILIWVVAVSLLTILSSRRDQLAGWVEFLAALVFTASAFSIAASLKYVSGYPFSMGWSEGNRLWDYSVLFGRELYNYPPNKNIPVLLDFGRRFVGGLPFLFSGVTITLARLWVGLTIIIPYLLLGAALFRASFRTHKVSWLLLTLWTFLFLKQGPIHPPLVLSAALVALAWRAPLWYAIPLVVGAGYFAESSRFTWIFASGIWIVMLEFASASFADSKSASLAWKRSLILGALGIFGGFVLPNMIGSAGALLPQQSFISPPPAAALAVVKTPTVTATATAQPAPLSAAKTPVTFFDQVVEVITIQPLLWYRLLPNSTYDNGILISLLLAVLPLLIILAYLSAAKIWQLNLLQKISLVIPLLAFFVVGLVASAKIGGGGDLHNMDMFLIGTLFAGALAWQRGGSDWIQRGQAIPFFIKIVMVALLVNSSIAPLFEMRSFRFGEDSAWLKTLTDAKSEDAMEMLPPQSEIDSALQTIQQEVDKAKLEGEVLFMDQRQLLTFGYIHDVPFVPEYEKKVLMNQALSADAAYFHKLYADLAAQRFSLIISEPLHTPLQDSSFQFGEENNAWVKWVARPILCHYESIVTMKNVRVELLVPRKNIESCPLP